MRCLGGGGAGGGGDIIFVNVLGSLLLGVTFSGERFGERRGETRSVRTSPSAKLRIKLQQPDDVDKIIQIERSLVEIKRKQRVPNRSPLAWQGTRAAVLGHHRTPANLSRRAFRTIQRPTAVER